MRILGKKSLFLTFFSKKLLHNQKKCFIIKKSYEKTTGVAQVAEQVDAQDLKSCEI